MQLFSIWDIDDVKFKTMVRSGLTEWKWPISGDVIWYSKSDFTDIIKQPNFTAVNKRGVSTLDVEI